MYAKRTKIEQARTRADIERLATQAKATHFGTAWDRVNGRARIEFVVAGRSVRFELEILSSWPEQRARQRWGALYLVIKAKLESVESGIETFDEAFLAHVLTPDGRRYGEIVIPQLEHHPENAGGQRWA